MGREVRKVPADWDHEKYSDKPLFDNFNKKLTNWLEGFNQWGNGYRFNYNDEKWIPITEDEKQYSYTDWAGDRPDPSDYMPDWDESERTHYQAYENITEGTPISPVFATEEEVIDFLVFTDSAQTRTYNEADRQYWANAIKTGIY